MDVFPIDAEVRSELEYVYRTCDDVNWRTRCHIVLLYDEGHSASELAELFKLSEDTILRAIARFREGGIEALRNRKRLRPAREKSYLPEDEELLVQIVRQSPRSLSTLILELDSAETGRVCNQSDRQAHGQACRCRHT